MILVNLLAFKEKNVWRQKVPLALSKRLWSGYDLMAKARETGHITVTKHSIEAPPKPVHIGILVFLRVDLYNMNLLLAF